MNLSALLFSRTHSGGDGLWMYRTRAAGTCVNARTGGEGPDVVCVHGLGVSGRYFVPLAERLRARARVHIPDLPGFGLTPGPRPALDVQGLAAALDSWMDAADLERATLVADSFGCQIAVALAVAHPERATGLVLNGPTTDPAARAPLPQLARLLRDAPREPPSLVPIVLRDYLATAPGRLVATARAMLADPIERKLPEVRAPAVVVRGARDPIVPDEWARRAVRLLPDAELVTIPGAAHTTNYGVPTEVARIIRDILPES